MRRASILAAQFALLGCRYPDAPQWTDLIEGPFTGLATIPSALTADIDWLVGATSVLSFDRKLFSVGINGTATRPTGVMFIDDVGADVAPRDNTSAAMNLLFQSLNLVHVPQGTQRERAVPFVHLARLSATQSVSTTVGATTSQRIGTGGPLQPTYTMIGGPWRINVQSDQLVIRPNQQAIAGGGVVLDSSVQAAFRVDGVFVVSGRAQQLGLLGSPPTCPPNPDVIAKLIAARRATGQHIRQPKFG